MKVIIKPAQPGSMSFMASIEALYGVETTSAFSFSSFHEIHFFDIYENSAITPTIIQENHRHWIKSRQIRL